MEAELKNDAVAGRTAVTAFFTAEEEDTAVLGRPVISDN